MLTTGELATLTRLSPEIIRAYADKGLYRGLRRRGKYYPNALPMTEVAVELGGLTMQGSITREECRDIVGPLRPRVIDAWLLSLAGKPVTIEITVNDTKHLRLHGALRAAEMFQTFVLA